MSEYDLQPTAKKIKLHSKPKIGFYDFNNIILDQDCIFDKLEVNLIVEKLKGQIQPLVVIELICTYLPIMCVTVDHQILNLPVQVTQKFRNLLVLPNKLQNHNLQNTRFGCNAHTNKNMICDFCEKQSRKYDNVCNACHNVQPCVMDVAKPASYLFRLHSSSILHLCDRLQLKCDKCQHEINSRDYKPFKGCQNRRKTRRCFDLLCFDDLAGTFMFENARKNNASDIPRVIEAELTLDYCEFKSNSYRASVIPRWKHY